VGGVLVGLCALTACGKSGLTKASPSAVNHATAGALSSAFSTAVGHGADPGGTKATVAGSPTVAASSAGGSGTEFGTFFGSRFDFSAAFCTFPHPLAAVADGVLTVTYPAGSSAPSAGAPYGGAQLCEPFATGPARSVTLTYEVRFPVGFQFVKGGKLPGIYGGVEPFSGGKHSSNGWSMRLMWRTGGAAEVYAYIATTSGYGDEYGKGNFRWLADGRWHTVSETVTVNTPGANDGSVRLAYDGTVYITQTGLAVTRSQTPALGLFFSTFYGGHDSSWAPTADMHIDFRNFTMSGR
jgi:hypothetical protein